MTAVKSLDQIRQLAEQGLPVPGVEVMALLERIDELEATLELEKKSHAGTRLLMTEARNAALEEAALYTACHFDDRPRMWRSVDFEDGYRDACRGASDAIRSLKDNTRSKALEDLAKHDQEDGLV